MGLSHRLRIASNIAELSLVIRAAGVTARIPFLLKKHDIRGVVERLTPDPRGTFEDASATGRPTGAGGLTQDRAVHLCRRVLRTFARFSYKVNCLRRCLLLYNCLRYYGVPVEINFGVKPGDGELLGHSWLTLDGRLLYDSEDEVAKFAHMFTLPDSRATGTPRAANASVGETGDTPGAEIDDAEMNLSNVSFDG